MKHRTWRYWGRSLQSKDYLLYLGTDENSPQSAVFCEIPESLAQSIRQEYLGADPWLFGGAEPIGATA